MRILGIDTSSPKGSLAITLKGKIISERTLPFKATYSKNFFLFLDSILTEANLELAEISAFAVSIGPGSFTGLRVGLSAALGLSLAQKKPVIPVDTLFAMAHTVPLTEYLICPIVDAKKGELYTSFFQYGKDGILLRRSEDLAITPETLLKKICHPTLFFGSGVETYGEVFRQKLGDLAIIKNSFTKTTAASVAILGYEKAKKGVDLSLNQLKPKYIRRSEAELNLGKSF